MNCFEARSDFVGFWQKTLAGERRTQLLTHLSRCASCDRSFRAFALSAPVLYSATEPEWISESAGSNGLDAHGFERSSAPPITQQRGPLARMLDGVLPAFVMAAAAAIALYFAVPPHMTFEDAISSDNSNAEVATYPSTDSLFGQELTAQGTTAPDPSDD
jgi:hypothetical protein